MPAISASTVINGDLIYGLPHQDPARFSATVDQIISINPDRIALFQLMRNVPWLKKTARRVRRVSAGRHAEVLKFFGTGLFSIRRSGLSLHRHGPFAKPGDELAVPSQEKRTLHRNVSGLHD